MTWVYGSNHKPGIQINLMNKSYYLDKDNYIRRFFYDLLFFYLTFVVVVNIFLGVLIGAFGEQRLISQKKNSDILNVCYICGGSREKFEKRNIYFEEHRNKTHNIWDYVSYFIYLRCNNSQDLNYNNSYAKDLILSQKISIFPVFHEKEEPEYDKYEKDIQELKQDAETSVRKIENNKALQEVAEEKD
jgi:hypothetical protein